MEKKKLFISYCSDNLDKVKHIKEELKNHPLFEPLVVADKRKANSALSKLVTEGIDASYRIIPILSPQSYKTQWINQEIGYAVCKKIPIIPVVEESILDELKGFVHKQNQCPYTYKAGRNGIIVRDENKRFMTSFRLLIQDLEEESKEFKREKILDANQSFIGGSRPHYSFSNAERDQTRGGNYIIKKGFDDLLYVNVLAQNGGILLTSETFRNKATAHQIIASIQRNCGNDVNYSRQLTKDMKHYFTLSSNNGEILGTSQKYASRIAMENTIELVKGINKSFDTSES